MLMIRPGLPFVRAPPSQNLAVKEICFVPRGTCGGFFVKFLAATFPGNSRAKICKSFRPNFRCMFRPRQRNISPEFRLSCTRLRVPPVALHLSRYTCRSWFPGFFIAFCSCSSGVAPHPLKFLVSRLSPPFPAGVAPKFGSEKMSRYTGVSQVQLRVSRYTVQLRSSLSENSFITFGALRAIATSFNIGKEKSAQSFLA